MTCLDGSWAEKGPTLSIMSLSGEDLCISDDVPSRGRTVIQAVLYSAQVPV